MKQREYMKQVRAFIIGILGYICIILMCGEPADEERWFTIFFITKGLAFLLGYITYLLCTHWESKGLLPDFEEK